MCEDCFAAIITVASIFWIEYLLFEPPRYGGSFFVARFDAARRDANSIVTTITMAAAKRRVRESCAGWTSRPDPGGRWSSRLVATAAEDRLNISPWPGEIYGCLEFGSSTC